MLRGVGNLKSALKSTSIWPKLRGAKSGAAFLAGEFIGRLPSGSLRTAGAKALGMKVAATAKLYRWREVRDAGKITIGDGTIIGMWATMDGREGITIGRNVNLSSEVALWTLQHDYNSPTFATSGGPIVIGDRAWISFRATILPGVTIGEGAVVAANSVVTKDVAPFTVVGGIPAKKIGERSRDLSYNWTNARSHAAWMI
jgi:acetyltransferase-like isoleucine patch superfamily enzyme